MELESEDGLKTKLEKGLKVLIGRGLGYQTRDRTVSRRHISMEVITTATEDSIRVSFEVIGKNPIWVLRKLSGEIRVFRRFEKGELGFDDLLCLSGKNPVWFSLKKNEDLEFESENEIGENSRTGFGFECADASGIDPDKVNEEFGFLVIGHEFDGYPKNMIRDVSKWEWFLEERRKDDDDNDGGKRGTTMKRKKVAANEDDDWTGESEDNKEMTIAKLRKGNGAKYSTRSRDRDRTLDKRKDEKSMMKKSISLSEDDEDTLGGFVVNDDDIEREEEEESYTDEEEEFVEGDDED